MSERFEDRSRFQVFFCHGRDRIRHEAEWNSNFTYVTNNTEVWIPRGIVSSGTDGYLEFSPSVS